MFKISSRIKIILILLIYLSLQGICWGEGDWGERPKNGICDYGEPIPRNPVDGAICAHCGDIGEIACSSNPPCMESDAIVVRTIVGSFCASNKPGIEYDGHVGHVPILTTDGKSYCNTGIPNEAANICEHCGEYGEPCCPDRKCFSGECSANDICLKGIPLEPHWIGRWMTGWTKGDSPKSGYTIPLDFTMQPGNNLEGKDIHDGITTTYTNIEVFRNEYNEIAMKGLWKQIGKPFHGAFYIIMDSDQKSFHGLWKDGDDFPDDPSLSLSKDWTGKYWGKKA